MAGEGKPVDIELVLERIGINIVPQANLRDGAGIEACISADLADLYIDLKYYLDDRMAFRVRFSEAHEAGHIVLHGDVFRAYRGNRPASVTEWARLINGRIETEILEREADEFAGCLLVPEAELRSLYEMHLPVLRERLRQKGLDMDAMESDTFRSCVAKSIHRVFEVSKGVIEVRLRKYGICPNE